LPPAPPGFRTAAQHGTIVKAKKVHDGQTPYKCPNCVYANIIKRALKFFLTSVKKNGSSEWSGDKPPIHLQDENDPVLSYFLLFAGFISAVLGFCIQETAGVFCQGDTMD
jgi:hypothetical protein